MDITTEGHRQTESINACTKTCKAFDGQAAIKSCTHNNDKPEAAMATLVKKPTR